MNQLNKHRAQRKIAFISVTVFVLLALSTSGTEHLGWLGALVVMSLTSILWLVYEENVIKQLEAKKSNKTWIR